MSKISKIRVKNKIAKSGRKFRLAIFRSNTNIYAQVIDVEKNITVAEANSIKLDKLKKLDAAFQVGKTVAEKAVKLGVKEVVFDRLGYQYHGRVEEVAKGARDAGLVF